MSKISSWAPVLLSVLRIVAALLFVEHGTSKIFDFPIAPSHPPGPPPPHFMMLLGQASGPIELIGGVFLAVGLFTRFSAFILSGEMAVAYFTAHAHGSFYPLVNKGELAVLYCFVFLYFAAAGGGPLSVDHLRHKS